MKRRQLPITVLAGLAGMLALLTVSFYGVQAWGKKSNNQPAAANAVTMQAETPVASSRPVLNITREEYEGALAKWKAQGAQEYRIVIDYLAFSLYRGTWTLQVKGGDVQVISFSQGNQPVAAPPTPEKEFFELLTVEGQFATINRALNGQPGNLGELDSGPQASYIVEFDPALGYPTQLTLDYGNMIADAGYSTTTRSVTIGNAGVPGMPSTGHPER